jgi:hypothetical protein
MQLHCWAQQSVEMNVSGGVDILESLLRTEKFCLFPLYAIEKSGISFYKNLFKCSRNYIYGQTDYIL